MTELPFTFLDTGSKPLWPFLLVQTMTNLLLMQVFFGGRTAVVSKTDRLDAICHTARLVLPRSVAVLPAGRSSRTQLLQVLPAVEASTLSLDNIRNVLDSMNLLLIGKTYLRLKNKERAIEYLTRARDYPAASAEDGEVGMQQSRADITCLLMPTTCYRPTQAKQEAAKLLQSL